MKNRNIIRLLVLVLAMVMMLVVVSCNKTPAQTTPEQTTPEPTTPPHVHTEEVIPAVAPTCTETGRTEGKKCSDCGIELVPQKEVPALGHTEVAIEAVAATCTEAGKTAGKKCSVCGVTTEAPQDVAALGHSYTEEVTKAATCTEKGEKVATCSACGDTQTLEVEALGHSYEEKVTKAATCTEKGEKVATCSACGDTQTLEIAALGHNWGDMNVSVEPTCAAGKGTHTCATCGVTEEAEIAPIKDHKYTASPSVIGESNCTTDGYEIYYCTACNYENKTVTRAPGHQAGEDGVCVHCKEYKQLELVWNDNQAAKVNTQNPPTSFYEINGWSVTNWIDRDSLPDGSLFIVKSGVWIYPEMLVDKTKNNPRPARFAGPTTIVMNDDWWKDYTTLAILGASGIKSVVEIWMPVEGANPADHAHVWNIVEKVPVTCEGGGEWTMTCTVCNKVEERVIEAPGHSRYPGFTNFSCSVCGGRCEYPAENIFNHEINYLAPTLPEKFKSNDTIVLTVFDADTFTVVPNDNMIIYDEVGATSKDNPMPDIHIYVKDENSIITWYVEAPETGVYELAFHLRIKDNIDRGTKVIVNRGTENEQEFDVNYDLGNIDYTRVMDYEITKSTYFYGPSLKVNLTEGMNTLQFAYPDDKVAGDGVYFYFRDIYLLKTDEVWTPAHVHVWSEEVQVEPATCDKDGREYYTCTNDYCTITKTAKVLPAGHTKGELIDSLDPTCESQRVNIYECTVCKGQIKELDASGDNARLNHTLNDNNQCTTCGKQFEVLDLGWTLGKEWKNDSIYTLYTMVDSDTACSTRLLTLTDLPIGSIIKVAAGYDGKIDGWDIYRTGVTGTRLTRRLDVSSFGARNYWNDQGADFTTQLDPTLGNRYGEFYFTVKREDGKPLTADDLAKALIVLVPVD